MAGQPEIALDLPVARAARRPRLTAKWLRRNLKGIVGLVLLGVVAVLAVGAPVLAPHDPLDQSIVGRLRPPAGEARALPGYPLGTDGLGRDVLSRVIYGAQISLATSVGATVLAVVIGLPLGLLAGYRGRSTEQLIMGLTDIQLAFPPMLLALTLMTVFSPSLTSLVIVLGLSGWAGFCRMVRGQVLSLRERDFVTATRALGAGDFHLVLRHILPNLLPVLVVLMTINVGRVVLAEASLSFVGLGVSAQTPSWGTIINSGREYIWDAWWITTFPGLAIVVTLVGLGFVGDWLRTLIDPRLRV